MAWIALQPSFPRGLRPVFQSYECTGLQVLYKPRRNMYKQVVMLLYADIITGKENFLCSALYVFNHYVAFDKLSATSYIDSRNVVY